MKFRKFKNMGYHRAQDRVGFVGDRYYRVPWGRAYRRFPFVRAPQRSAGLRNNKLIKKISHHGCCPEQKDEGTQSADQGPAARPASLWMMVHGYSRTARDRMLEGRK